jgi:hypothetical protein
MTRPLRTVSAIASAIPRATRAKSAALKAAAEALKRFMFLDHEANGGSSGPAPTPDEVGALLLALARWLRAHADIPPQPLADFWEAFLANWRQTTTPGPVPLPRGEMYRADGVLNEMVTWLTRPSTRKTYMSVDVANRKARAIARVKGKVFWSMTLRKQAMLIGCSMATWKKTETYQTALKAGRAPAPVPKGKGPPLAASLTDKTLEVLAVGRKQEVLEGVVEREDRTVRETLEDLIAEQRADMNADSRPAKVRLRGKNRL